MPSKSRAPQDKKNADFKEWLSKEFSDPARYAANLVSITKPPYLFGGDEVAIP
jgi:hypothetical protein